MKVRVTARTALGVPAAWIVVDDAGEPHRETSRFLTYLDHIEYSPNTIRAYAYDLSAYLNYLRGRGLLLDDVSNEVLAGFAHWLRSPSPNVIASGDQTSRLERTTVNRTLAAVSSFYRFLGAGGPTEVGYRGFDRLRVSAAIFKPKNVSVIDNVTSARGRRTSQRLGPRLPQAVTAPKILSVQQMTSILDACADARERFLLSLAAGTGMRLGQMLGLRHTDIDTVGHRIALVPREDSENGARIKSRRHHQIPISRDLARLYTCYMHDQYGFIESEYVFINLRGRNVGRAMTPSAVNAIVRRLRTRSGVSDWSIHTLRHTFVTLSQQAGVPIDVISSLVTHASIETTVRVYSHLDVEGLRAVLLRCGAWDEAAL